MATKISKDKLQTYIVYGVAGLVVLVVGYFILKPRFTSPDQQIDQSINTNFPDPKDIDLRADLYNPHEDPEIQGIRSAEEQQEEELAQSMKTISNLQDSLALIQDNSELLRVSSSSPDIFGDEVVQPMSRSEWEEEYQKAYEKSQLEAQLENAKVQLALMEEANKTMQQQSMMAQSYYQGMVQNSPEALQAQAEREAAERAAAEAGAAERRARQSSDRNLSTISTLYTEENVVSSLSSSQPTGDSMAIVINRSFETPVGTSQFSSSFRNTINVIVKETQKVKSGERLLLSTVDDLLLADDTLLPRNTTLSAQVGLNGNRMNVTVDAIEHKGRIVGVKLSGYDLSGQQGVYVPWSTENAAIAELGENFLANSQSSSINLNNSTTARDQVVADVARSVIQTGTRYATRKLNDIHVVFKAGYRLYLMDTSVKH